MPGRLRRLVIGILLVAAGRGGAGEAPLEVVTLAAPADAAERTVAAPGVRLVASAPTRLTGALALQPGAVGGLQATIVASSLRATTADDWRPMGIAAGERHDPRIDLPTPRAGTPEERARFKVGGSDDDWDGISIQWDGWLRVERPDTGLALSSDDGSRCWIDRDGDGAIGPGEWGDNGWGTGHGEVLTAVHQHLQPGVYRIRVQWEDGGGPNCCRLLWNGISGAPNPRSWTVVPDEAFANVATAVVDGPITVAGVVSGAGSVLRLAGGARLETVPAVAAVEVADRAALAADCALAGVALRLAPQAELSCAGHALAAARADGGTIALAGGSLALPAGRHAVAVHGPGTLRAAVGTTRVERLDADVAVVGERCVVRDGQRCVARMPVEAPLARIVPLRDDAPDALVIAVTLEVPPDAPADLGLAAWRADRGGAWYQAIAPGPLAPGRHELALRLDQGALLAAEGHRGRWSAEAAASSARAGLVLFASLPGHGVVTIDARIAALPTPSPGAASARLADLELDDLRGGSAHARTGRRWQMRVRPIPWPANPYDPAVFRADLEITAPDGSTARVAAFADQPVRRIDRGDAERFVADGSPCFRVRWRARMPGRHRLRLITARDDGAERAVALPDVIAEGEPWDGFVQPDAGDPRFFSVGGRFLWPVGHNLNSVFDTRSRANLGTRLTPDRGSFARDALLERLAAAGGTGCETWLSPWNLGLEWTPDWPGYAGAGRYHPGHAWALDRFLDRAEQLGVYVNLSLFNHGQARDGAGAEDDWPHHPWRDANGGWLAKPAELFRDPRAFRAQCALFRYLGARWGDCPALLGWKLWAEVNLAHADHDQVVAWHDRAARALHEADPAHRAVTTHWCGDWRNADPAIARLPSIGYLTIDAYHDGGTMIADLLAESVADPRHPDAGLERYRKPVWVSEFGGSAGACPRPRMAAEWAIGPWAALVSGHGASPLLWWFEWIDQQELATPYAALRRFLAGEDLRGAEAKCVAPLASLGEEQLWCRAWSRPGRMLGYALDPAWARQGGDARRCEGVRVVVDGSAAAGPMRVEWWDPDRGQVVGGLGFDHPGGAVTLDAPAFQRHLAFKLWREAR